MIALVAALAFQTAPAFSAPAAARVSINVRADPAYTRPHTISISSETPRRPRSVEELRGRVWIATRTWDGGSQTISSAECPALTSVAMSFGELPDVPIGPAVLAVTSGAIPIPPTMKYGFATSLSFQALTEDGSTAQVTVDGGNAYRSWGQEAVSRLIPCWGPLRP